MYYALCTILGVVVGAIAMACALMSEPLYDLESLPTEHAGWQGMECGSDGKWTAWRIIPEGALPAWVDCCNMQPQFFKIRRVYAHTHEVA